MKKKLVLAILNSNTILTEFKSVDIHCKSTLEEKARICLNCPVYILQCGDLDLNKWQQLKDAVEECTDLTIFKHMIQLQEFVLNTYNKET